MKVVPDTMIWVSYTTRKGGFRHRLIERARSQRVRLYVSEYILDELVKVLVEDIGLSRRYALLARRAVLRVARLVRLPAQIGKHVSGDPKDDPVLQSALTSKAHYLVTADKTLLSLRKIRNLEILTATQLSEKLA